MRRRDILAGAGSLAAGATSSFPAPAIAQGIRQLKMVTDWPEGCDRNSHQRGSFRADDRHCDRRTHQDRGISSGRIGAPVRNLRCGQARAWLTCTIRRRLLREEVAGDPFLLRHSLRLHRRRTIRVGAVRRRARAMGRARRPIQHQVAALHQHRLPDGWLVHPRDHVAGEFKGLRYRMAGPGAEVLRRMGAIVVILPGGEIMQALKSAPLTPANASGPGSTWRSVCTKPPAITILRGCRTGTAQAVGIDKGVWESLDASDRRVIEAVAASEYVRSLAEFDTNNALSLRKLRDEGSVKITEVRTRC